MCRRFVTSISQSDVPIFEKSQMSERIRLYPAVSENAFSSLKISDSEVSSLAAQNA